MRREDIAHAVADAATAVPGVARLSPGSGVEVATLYAGGKVIGVRLSGEAVEVHIVANTAPLQPVATEVNLAVRRVLGAAGDNRPVNVVVDDVEAAAVNRRER